jgi:hypothetical protein
MFAWEAGASDQRTEDDLSGLSAQDLQEGFARLQRTVQRLEAERLRWLAEIERREVFRRDGHLSAQAWLASKHRMSFPEAARQARTAKALDGMAAAKEAMASGELSNSAVNVLVRAKEAAPRAFGEAEGMLVQAARSLPARELLVAVDRWLENAHVDSATQEAEAMAERLTRRRRLDVSPVPSGMVRVDGDLDPEAGQIVITALRAVIDAQVKSEAFSGRRTPAQRRADGLSELCRQWLDRNDRPSVGGERPHVSVVVHLERLTGGSGRSELPDTGWVPSQWPAGCPATRRFAAWC